jgi:hypothetical protein
VICKNKARRPTAGLARAHGPVLVTFCSGHSPPFLGPVRGSATSKSAPCPPPPASRRTPLAAGSPEAAVRKQNCGAAPRVSPKQRRLILLRRRPGGGAARQLPAPEDSLSLSLSARRHFPSLFFSIELVSSASLPRRRCEFSRYWMLIVCAIWFEQQGKSTPTARSSRRRTQLWPARPRRRPGIQQPPPVPRRPVRLSVGEGTVSGLVPMYCKIIGPTAKGVFC